jgi:hypothetical protein
VQLAIAGAVALERVLHHGFPLRVPVSLERGTLPGVNGGLTDDSQPDVRILSTAFPRASRVGDMEKPRDGGWSDHRPGAGHTAVATTRATICREVAGDRERRPGLTPVAFAATSTAEPVSGEDRVRHGRDHFSASKRLSSSATRSPVRGRFRSRICCRRAGGKAVQP